MKDQMKMGFNGPLFLSDKKQSWLQKCETIKVNGEDPRLKTLISSNKMQIQEN